MSGQTRYFSNNNENSQESSKTWAPKSHADHLQGQPLGFDTKYLALADRNMQVRFGLKVV